MNTCFCFSIGGKGNYYFLSNMNRAPTECELGANGDKKKYKLELQLIAHFGLVSHLLCIIHGYLNICLAWISKRR
jgi:hypothetical protein